MKPGLRKTVVAVAKLTDGTDLGTNIRAVMGELGVPFSTAQGRILRAVEEGVLTHEPSKSNTIRLAPGITVHNGDVFRLIPIGDLL